MFYNFGRLIVLLSLSKDNNAWASDCMSYTFKEHLTPYYVHVCSNGRTFPLFKIGYSLRWDRFMAPSLLPLSNGNCIAMCNKNLMFWSESLHRIHVSFRKLCDHLTILWVAKSWIIFCNSLICVDLHQAFILYSSSVAGNAKYELDDAEARNAGSLRDGYKFLWWKCIIGSKEDQR